ncbi:MAG: radical SAM protein, partial [Planctomycetes bacterium]|nr:radical SAM protein [Planctomycetota bacterium]
MLSETIHSPARKENMARLQEEVAARKTRTTARPIELAIEITRDCPYRCIHCYRAFETTEHRRFNHLDPAMLDRLGSCWERVVRILFTGDGEPLAHPDFPEILDRCLNSGAEVSLSTNGTDLNPALIRRMVEGSLAHIQFSIDAATPDRYKAIRKGSRLETAVRNLKGLAATRSARGAGPHPFISVACVVMQRNVDQLPAVAALAAQSGADQMLFQPLMIPEAPPQFRELFRLESLSLERQKEAVEKARAAVADTRISVISPEIDAWLSRGAGGTRTWNQRFAPTPTGHVISRFNEIQAAMENRTSPSPSGEASLSEPETTETEPPAPEPESPTTAPAATPPLPCTQPWTTCTVHADGTISPCMVHPKGMVDLKGVRDLLEHWNGPD